MMNSEQIVQEVIQTYGEYLEMMDAPEKFIVISRALADKAASEMAQKEYFKSCFEAAMNMKQRINS